MTSPSGPSVTTCVTPIAVADATPRCSVALAATSAVRASIQSRLRYRSTAAVCLPRVVSAAVV